MLNTIGVGELIANKAAEESQALSEQRIAERNASDHEPFPGRGQMRASSTIEGQRAAARCRELLGQDKPPKNKDKQFRGSPP
jgi:hypothetical protein